MGVIKNLKHLQASYEGCEACELKCHRNKVVFGRGNPKHPMLMCIGEAPGRAEDQSGLPWEGDAGKTFWGLLRKSSIDKDDVYCTNMVMCRPKGNRDPTAAEMRACRSRLEQQIQIIRPNALLLVGRIALNLLGYGVGGVAANRGVIHEVELDGGIWYAVSTYHPSYLNRTQSGDIQDAMVQDMHLAWSAAEIVSQYRSEYASNPNQACFRELNSKSKTAIAESTQARGAALEGHGSARRSEAESRRKDHDTREDSRGRKKLRLDRRQSVD